MSQQDTPTSKEALARAMAAYLPVTLVRHILDGDEIVPGRPTSRLAATLFADISGFTAMSEELASDGTRGAEELNRVLLITFTAMLDVIHEMGGAVSHFYGDAMSVYFPDEDNTAVARALACAQMMQRLMATSYGKARTNRPQGKEAIFDLTIKIGVGYGRCQELVVGDSDSMEFVLAGTAVDEAAEAERRALSGEIVATRTVLARANLVPTSAYQIYEADIPQLAPAPILQWSRYDEADFERLIKTAIPYIPTLLNLRLQEIGVAEMADHRPVTSLFVQFQFKGDKEDGSAIESMQMGQRLQAYYQWAVSVVRRFGAENGRVNRVLTGDKGNQLHIMFGAPVAPDAPEQALRCAMALLREQPDMVAHQKIGVAVGKVFAAPVGSPTRREYTVVGDVVNLSARLMQICPPGEVLTNQTTMTRTRQWLEFEPLPPRYLKGKQEKITPYKIVDDRTASSQIQSYVERWKRPLFGRDSEIEKLVGLLDRALAGQGSVLTLSGNTGTGKSRLLAYGINHWLAEGGTGLLGVCLQHTVDIPYAPWRAIWRDFFGIQASMTMQEQVEAVINQTGVLTGSTDDVGLWADPLGLPVPQSDKLKTLTAEARQARFFALVKRCMETAVARQPVLIVIEGIQYADASSVALLEELAADIAEHSLFIAVSFRPVGSLTSKLLEDDDVVQLRLNDLSSEHARQILRERLGTDSLPPAIEQQLGLRDRDGRDSPVNPLFLEESLNVMLAAGVIEQENQLSVHEELLSQMQLPDTIHGLLLARLDRLPPTERDLLQLASVIGRQFEVDSLSFLANTNDRTPVLEMLTDLTKADMTHLVTADPEWVYLFQHAMTHEVAYESLPYARRQQLHSQVANWLQERNADNLRPYYPVLAFHYSRANLHEPALEYSLRAAQDAKAIFANQEAVELFTLAERHLRALGMEAHWETAVDLLLARAKALRLIGNFEMAVADAELAEKLLQNQSNQTKYPAVLNLLAELKCRQAEFKSGEALALTVVEMLGDQQSLEMARAYQLAGYAASSLGNYEQALQRLRIAEKIGRRHNDLRQMAAALENIAFVHYLQKDLRSALQAMQQSAEMSREFNVPTNVAAAFSNVSLIQFQLGMPYDALESIDQAIQFAQNVSRNFLARAYNNKAEALTYIGVYPEALEAFSEAIKLFAAMDDKQGLIEGYLLFGYEYLIATNQLDQAKKYLQDAGQLIDKLSLSSSEEEVRMRIGLSAVRLQQEEFESVERDLSEAIDLLEAKNYSWWKPVAYYYLGRYFSLRGNVEKATESLQTAVEAVKNEGCPDYLPLVYLELARLVEEPALKRDYLKQCLAHSVTRSKHHHKQYCYETGSQLLLKLGDHESNALAEAFKQKLTDLVT